MASILNVDKIRATGSTTDGILVSSAGVVTKPQLPAFFVHKTSAQSVADGAYTKLSFDTELFDNGGFFDLANNKFAPTIAGYYQLSWRAQFLSTGSPSTVWAALYKNGSSYCRGSETRNAGGSEFGSAGSTVVHNDGNDEFEVYIFFDGSGTGSVHGSAHTTNFSGHLVG